MNPKTKLRNFFLRAKFSLKCRDKSIAIQIYKTDESFDKLFLPVAIFSGKKHFWAPWFSGTGFAWPWVCDRDPLWLTSNCYGAAHTASVVQVSTNRQQLFCDWLLAVSTLYSDSQIQILSALLAIAHLLATAEYCTVTTNHQLINWSS